MSLVNKRHLYKISNFKEFAYNFSDGRPMPDTELVKWMTEMYNNLINDTSTDGNYSLRACGSSLIIAHKYFENDNSYDIAFYIVDGYKELTLFNKEIGEDFQYCEDPDLENKPSVFFHKEEEAL